MKVHKLSFLITLIACLTAALLPGTADARATKLIEPAQVTTSCDLSIEKMKEAIITGGAGRGWTPVNQTNEFIELKYTKGSNKHILLVSVAFTNNTFAVSYMDSTNLNYKVKRNGVRELHPRPIVWMSNLSNDIRIKTDIFCSL